MASVNEGYKPARNWWFILYPESAPVDWLDLLQSRAVPFAVSPLHDQCLDENGNVKKPHYHIILTYDGPTTYNHVLELTRSLGQPIPLRVESLSGAYSYLTHANAPDKHQYNADDIRLYNGFKVPRALGGKGEKIMARAQLCSLIQESGIVEFAQLVELVVSGEYPESVFNSLFRDAYFYNQYITSCRFIAQARAIRRDEAESARYGRFFVETQHTPDLSQIPDFDSDDASSKKQS